ncbi:peritrophin-1-like [Mizuhopecten yessoensis]|uniref:Endochitinase n=1 Tax=Mizuhopecten yessoensis TaxID=6573 RepID=A0A210QW89_MIZYE|nr:peritrophin-1-like [Mizuhopecten yessoensis]OWF53027.1 Endochitinase [Mizuhopecten yessoensis]
MFTSKAFVIACCLYTLGSLMTVSGTPAPGSFCSMKANGDYRHPMDCYEHIKCSNGIAHVFDCPASTLWDDSKKRCENTSDLPSCNSPFTCVGRADGSYANPTECTSYYVCDEQITHLMQCPATTHYDPTMKVCDHAVNVPCP